MLFNLDNVVINETIIDDEYNIIKVVELWKKYEYMPTIAEQLNISLDTTRKLLKRAINYNLLDISYEQLKRINGRFHGEKIRKSKGIRVKCIETGQVFDSINQAQKSYNCSLYRYFDGKNTYSGKLPDGTKLHWEKVGKE